MAYIAFTDTHAAYAPDQTLRERFLPIGGPVALIDEDRQAEVALTPLEWSVVEIARNDRLSSLRRAGRWDGVVHALFPHHNAKLADPRLEALRRMAVLSWHRGYAVPPEEVEAFLNAGFSTDHYEAMVTRIGHVRAQNGRRR